MKQKLLIISSMIFLYGISTTLSYALFDRYSSNSSQSTQIADPTPLSEEETNEKRANVNPNLPRTEVCPLNGDMYTTIEKEIWQTRRPLGVMIENHTEARPQSGLNSSDIVYEAVAEGGITRFLSIFYCSASASDVEIGPVRSARTYFVDWVSEYGTYPLYAHVGGANCNKTTGSGCLNGAKADALGQIQKYGWNLYNNMNQMVGGDLGVRVFRRDNRLEKFTGKDNIAYEHTMYTSTDKLWNVAANRGVGYTDDRSNQAWDINFTPWIFQKQPITSGLSANTIEYTFWNQFASMYDVKWVYDSANDQYLRFNGGVEHIDLETKKQISASTVIVAFMKESRANDGYENNLHLLYENKGSGQAYIFMNGKKIEALWSKKDRTARTLFTDKSGKPIELSPGKIWISIIPTTNQSKVLSS